MKSQSSDDPRPPSGSTYRTLDLDELLPEGLLEAEGVLAALASVFFSTADASKPAPYTWYSTAEPSRYDSACAIATPASREVRPAARA